MSDASNELILGIWSLTLSAKGTPAVWLVVPVSAILIAFATVTILAAALHATIETTSREVGRRVAAATRGGYAMSEAEAPMRPD